MPDSITRTFKAVADPIRREIMHSLVSQKIDTPISHLSKQFEISRQGVTKHVKILESAGLISIQTKGRERYCIPNARPLKEIQDWLNSYEQFWTDSLSRLEAHLDKSD